MGAVVLALALVACANTELGGADDADRDPRGVAGEDVGDAVAATDSSDTDAAPGRHDGDTQPEFDAPLDGSADAAIDTAMDAVADAPIDSDAGVADGDIPLSDVPTDGDTSDSLPPPVAHPPDPPPDRSSVVFALAGARPDRVADSCPSRGGTNDFLFEVVRQLRAEDARWGLAVRDGRMGDDLIAYFYGDGEAEGSDQAYVIDVISSVCGTPGVDDPPTASWLDVTGTGGRWTLAPLTGDPIPPVDPPPETAPLPDRAHVVRGLADERPDLLAASCVEAGGNNEFLFELVRRLRREDTRWGLNWKRGVVGEMSQDVIDYYFGSGDAFEGATDVYILDIIVNHCPDEGTSSEPGWTDVTEATRDAGTIGRWTLAGREDLGP